MEGGKDRHATGGKEQGYQGQAAEEGLAGCACSESWALAEKLMSQGV